jgi:hypothetical protein
VVLVVDVLVHNDRWRPENDTERVRSPLLVGAVPGLLLWSGGGMLVVMLGSLRTGAEAPWNGENSGENLTPSKAADPQALQDGMVGEWEGRRAVQSH